jgi:hypothetical protein
MVMITIPKEELLQVEATIKEKNRIIEQQKNSLEAMEGFRLYHAVQFAESGMAIAKLIKLLNVLVVYSPGTPEEAGRLSRLDDMSKEVIKHEKDRKTAIAIWQQYLRDHPLVEKILIGEFNLQLPDLVDKMSMVPNITPPKEVV